jgi:hypothetical protein
VSREDVRVMVRALRDLDRMAGHQPFADLVAREFASRRAPGRRCPGCFGPLDGWVMAGRHQVVFCNLCTTFDEAMAYLNELNGPPPSEREQAERYVESCREDVESAKADLEYAEERLAKASALTPS